MTRWHQVATIAQWEFTRFVKWRQQFIGVGLMLGLSTLVSGVSKLASGSRSSQTEVAVVGAGALGYPLPGVDGVTWNTNRYSTTREARDAVTAGSIPGALLLDDAGHGVIIVRRKAAWTARVAPALTSASQMAAYGRLPISPDERRALSTPFTVGVEMLNTRTGTDSSSSRLYAAILIGLGLFVLFSGFASLFAGITGEKQQRITEQMLSMVQPQTWMDGKIIGLAGAAVVGTVFLAASMLIATTVLPRLMGKSGVTLPPLPSELGVLALIALTTVLGTAMWFAFMAAIAATIDDPNSSPRTAMLFIPMLPAMLAFNLISRSESTVAQVLAIFPLTSMAVLPVRLLATSVPWWEPVLAVLFLAMSAWTFRRAAGKIFATGVLLHGKEPSMAEAFRWAREA